MVICSMTDMKAKSGTKSYPPEMPQKISQQLMQAKKNTRAEFKRLKTILPSLRRREHVSKLDIILEAIKYIDDLQDQLIDRLGGAAPAERHAALLALTSCSPPNHLDHRLQPFGCFTAAAALSSSGDITFHCGHTDNRRRSRGREDLINLSDGYMSDPGRMAFSDDDQSHHCSPAACLEL